MSTVKRKWLIETECGILGFEVVFDHDIPADPNFTHTITIELEAGQNILGARAYLADGRKINIEKDAKEGIWINSR